MVPFFNSSLNFLAGTLALGLLTSPLQAGQISISDTARVGHRVELVAINISIVSQCYPSQAEVLKVSHGAGAKIKAILVSHMDRSATSRDKIIAAPGFTTRKTLTRYDDVTRRTVEVCKNAWHAENHFTLNLANYEAWSQLQSDILGVIDSYQSSETQPAVTTITLNEPVPMLYPETRDKLLMESRMQALQRASVQFKKIAELCHLRKQQITAISPLDQQPKLRYAAGRTAGGDPDDSFQPVFDQIYINAGWMINWEFTDAGDGCSAAVSS